MKQLGQRNYDLLSQGAKISGNYTDAYFYAEEQLYMDEAAQLHRFCKWCDADIANRGWGWGNYEERFAEFLAQDKEIASGLFADGAFVTGEVISSNAVVTWIKMNGTLYNVKNTHLAEGDEDEQDLRKRLQQGNKAAPAPATPAPKPVAPSMEQRIENVQTFMAANTAAPVEKKRRAKITDEVVAQIRTALADNIKQSEIAKTFDVDPATVSDIKFNRGRFAPKKAE